MVDLQVYSIFSLAGAATVLARAWMMQPAPQAGEKSYEMFAAQILSSKLSLLVLVNFVYALMYLVGKYLTRFFFGKLSDPEHQHAYDRIVHYAMFKVLFIASVLEPDNLQTYELLIWTGWFSLLGFAKFFTIVSRERFNHLLTFSPEGNMRAHIRVLGCICLVFAINLRWLVFIFRTVSDAGWSTLLLLTFECYVLFVETSELLTKYAVHFWEQNFRGGLPWEGKAHFYFYTSLVADVLVHSLTLAHYAHILRIHGITFLDALILLDMRLVFNALRSRLSDLRNYRLVCQTMNEKFADATAEELRSLDDVCVICRDPMERAKKLPCGHIFHTACLRTWLETHHNCPTCRRELLELPARPQPQPVRHHHIHRHTHHFYPAQQFRRYLPQHQQQPVPVPAPVPPPPAMGGQPANGPAAARESVFQFTSDHWPTSWLLPSFSFEVVRSEENAHQAPSSDSLEQMLRQCQELFPHVDSAVLRADLARTRSVEMTTENIVEGRLPQRSH